MYVEYDIVNLNIKNIQEVTLNLFDKGLGVVPILVYKQQQPL